jgi:hypothetical protein
MVLRVLDVLSAVVLVLMQVAALFALAITAARQKDGGLRGARPWTEKVFLVLVVVLPLVAVPTAYGLWRAQWWVSALAEGAYAVTFLSCLLSGLATGGGRRLRGRAADHSHGHGSGDEPADQHPAGR